MNTKLTDTQVKKLKTAAKNKTGSTLRMSLKMFDGNDLPHELLLTRRQKKVSQSLEIHLITIFQLT